MSQSVSPKLRKKIWQEMLTADWNCRYWSYLYQRYDRYDRGSKIFLAITSSSTVAGWTFWAQVDWIWKSLSATSALLAIIVPYMDWHNSMERLLELRAGWLELKFMYEKLWIKIENKAVSSTDVQRDRDEMNKIQRPLDEKASRFSLEKSLAEKCQREVLESRNLS